MSTVNKSASKNKAIPPAKTTSNMHPKSFEVQIVFTQNGKDFFIPTVSTRDRSGVPIRSVFAIENLPFNKKAGLGSIGKDAKSIKFRERTGLGSMFAALKGDG